MTPDKTCTSRPEPSRTCRLAGGVVGLILSQAIAAQPTLVFVVNYDAKLSVAGELSHITNQARVRNGRTIPIEFQRHRIDITIDNTGDGRYRAVVNLFERSDDSWYKVTLEDLTFDAIFAAPVNLQWQEADLSLDLAIAVSVSNQ